MPPLMDTVLQEVIGLELVLLNPLVRAIPEEVGELLHADFVEYGASGRVWDRASLVAALAADPGAPVSVEDLQAAALGEGAVQVRYRMLGDAASLRTSIWVHDGAGWRLWFHQGTPA